MNIIADTELILTPENKIYHLNLSKEEIADDIILVGDPDRVTLISNKFDSIEHKIQNREFVTHTGTLNGKKISAIATGIGPDNIDIVINELDSLVNIDFKTRTINKTKKKLNLIRLGTSGALQKDIAIDTFIASSYGLGFDGLAHFYQNKEMLEQEMANAYTIHANWPVNLATPYFIKASECLLA
jgi:uridine phosphorylase